MTKNEIKIDERVEEIIKKIDENRLKQKEYMEKIIELRKENKNLREKLKEMKCLYYSKVIDVINKNRAIK